MALQEITKGYLEIEMFVELMDEKNIQSLYGPGTTQHVFGVSTTNTQQ